MKTRPPGAERGGGQGAVETAPWDADDADTDAGASAGQDAARWPGEARTALLVSVDAGLRRRLASSLERLRWGVREASGGAQAMAQLEACEPEAMLVDTWLPDLEVGEFAAHARLLYPRMDVMRLDGGPADGGLSGSLAGEGQDGSVRSPRRNELLHAMREARDESPGPAAERPGYPLMKFAAEPVGEPGGGAMMRGAEAYRLAADGSVTDGSLREGTGNRTARIARSGRARTEWADGGGAPGGAAQEWMLAELVGASRAMRELARLVRLVAPRSTTVLIEGETGTGKEVVARAVHRLSARAGKPFAVLNCAAIPEYLLEAELFGHTRGAFTGAVQSRMGRSEAAHGGTLLLDEIGEMPVGMQVKMLRFLESGELQRVGDNETTRVDVRLIAATHQPLEQRSAEGTFRLDLYHRLAVFPIAVPALRERMEDIPALAEHFLEQLGKDSPRKRLLPGAAARLEEHLWPGNVRELMHVLERGVILAGANPEIAAADIRCRRAARAEAHTGLRAM